MSVSFSQAALDRIAQCASSETYGLETSPITALLNQYLSRDPEHGLGGKDFPDLEDTTLDELSGNLEPTALERANALYRFAGLLEIAIQVGYVDLSGWSDAIRLNDALHLFVEREARSETPTDLTLVDALIGRLEAKQWDNSTRDNDAFFAFGSFLHLTTCIRDDREALQFLRESSRNWSAPDDLPFLLTPRHFAEAVTFQTVGGLPSKTVVRALSALRYLQWFGEILESVKQSATLAEAFVRQARWSHHTPAVGVRVSLWVERMSEWSPSGVDPEGEQAWGQFRATALWPINRHLDRIGFQRAKHSSSNVRPFQEPTIGELLIEGRVGAARKLARQLAERISSEFRTLPSDDDSECAAALISACEQLETMGDVDAAAAIVARFLDKLTGWNLEAAQKLLAASRSSQALIASPQGEQPVSVEKVTPYAEQPKESAESQEGSSFAQV